jgi:heptosyltransferase-2
MAREIKRLLPDCHLTVLCRADTAEIFHSSSWVDETLQDDKRGALSGISGLWRLSRAIKSRGFDLAIVPHRSLRSALLVRLAGIPRRIGFSSSAGRFLFTQTLPFTWGMHDLERNLGLLLPLSPAPPQSPSEQETVYLQPQARKEAGRRIAEILSGAGITTDRRLVGFHPGSIWPTKRWPEDRYAALIRRLYSQADIRPILVGGKNDTALAARIIQQAQVPVLDLTGKTSLSELIALMGRLSLFITNDSGPMHVATASGVPTLAFFGPTTKELGFFPYGPEHKVLEVDLACRPCGLHGAKVCPEGHFLCMRLISVDWALRTAIKMLDARTVPPLPPAGEGRSEGTPLTLPLSPTGRGHRGSQ